MASVNDFDFQAYLRRLDLRSSYEITLLSGGVANITVRARRTSPVATDSMFQGRHTVVMKYAPPFIAEFGESAPFDSYRQVIEAKALRFLANTPEISAAQKVTAVRVPKLLLEDHESHIIIMDDLGPDLFLLDDWLDTNPSLELCQSVGKRLGTFLATVHGYPISKETLEEFVNPDAQPVLQTWFASRIGEFLRTYLHLSEHEVQDVCTIIEEAHNSPILEEEVVWAVRDLWIGSILVNKDASTIGVVDFEFAGEGRALQDMCQLAARLHLQALASSPLSRHPAKDFITSLHKAYRSVSSTLRATWLHPGPHRDSAIRAGWILHGRQMIYNCVIAKYHVWPGEKEGDVQVEERRRAMMECGLSEDGFLRELYTVDTLTQ